MDHGLELIIPILEIFEIEVFNILYNPGNIEKLFFSIFYYPGRTGNRFFSYFLLSWKYMPNIFFILPGNIENRFSRRAGQDGRAGHRWPGSGVGGLHGGREIGGGGANGGSGGARAPRRVGGRAAKMNWH